jgi:hypothetical protein
MKREKLSEVIKELQQLKSELLVVHDNMETNSWLMERARYVSAEEPEKMWKVIRRLQHSLNYDLELCTHRLRVITEGLIRIAKEPDE